MAQEFPMYEGPEPRDSATRKGQPIATGVLAYFPKAMAAIAEHSRRGNDKHNPGEPLHWAREKSTDEADSAVRHITDALADGPLALDADGGPHLVGAAWRVLAWLERALECDERWRTVAKPAPVAADHRVAIADMLAARTPTDGELDELVRNRDRYTATEFRHLLLALCGVA